MNLPKLRNDYSADGYAVANSLFSRAEAEFYRQHFMMLREADSYRYDLATQWDDDQHNPQSTDPLKRYPRMFNMHHWDETSRDWLLDERLRQCLVAMLGQDPYAVQTMLYFKPPGSRGQALHQDQYYLRARPGTSIAAWMALEPIDETNGCLQVVPNTQDLPLICPEAADEDESFTTIVVPLPPGFEPMPICMEPGDVLFFNGQIVHGSFPNTTSDRFRCSLVGHYIEGGAIEVMAFDRPVLRMDGTIFEEIKDSPTGGECGVWVDQNGEDLVDVSRVYASTESIETVPIQLS